MFVHARKHSRTQINAFRGLIVSCLKYSVYAEFGEGDQNEKDRYLPLLRENGDDRKVSRLRSLSQVSKWKGVR